MFEISAFRKAEPEGSHAKLAFECAEREQSQVATHEMQVEGWCFWWLVVKMELVFLKFPCHAYRQVCGTSLETEHFFRINLQ